MDRVDEIVIRASPSIVWRHLTDTRGMVRHVPYLRSVEILSSGADQGDGRLSEGTRLLMRFGPSGARTIAVQADVTEATPPSRLHVYGRTEDGIAEAAIRWALRPTGSNTRVVQRFALSFESMVARVAANAILGGIDADRFDRGLQRLKESAEMDRGTKEGAG